uniref:DUF6602 domain-containing protein n=2 Tax=Enterocloster clostridioformis TaxID=1531 RepID=UPI0034E8BE75
MWLQLFQMIVPNKFVIEHSVFIIDSAGNVSKEVDLAIINTYTPYGCLFVGRLVPSDSQDDGTWIVSQTKNPV